MTLPSPLPFSKVGVAPTPYVWPKVPVDVLVFSFSALKLPMRGSGGHEPPEDGDGVESLLRAASGIE